jgi:hypothetical protein
MTLPLIPATWTGEAFEPRPNFRTVADKVYVIGEVYMMAAQEMRSASSHAHYFASIAEAWRNLPERLAPHWPSPDHLRKAALIKAGYCDQRTLVASSKAEASRIAAFVRPMDEYALVSVSGATVVVLTAQSQSYKAMGKAKFNASKEAVLNVLADVIGVSPQELSINAGRAA